MIFPSLVKLIGILDSMFAESVEPIFAHRYQMEDFLIVVFFTFILF